MPVMRASSDWRWLSALVTFCALSGSSQRSNARLLAEPGDLGLEGVDVDDGADVTEGGAQGGDLLREVKINMSRPA